ncbi:MAG: hypothetical protein V3T72_07605 [Thermoanaerobaculia bacterium]
MLRNSRQVVWLLVILCTGLAVGQLGALEPHESSSLAVETTFHHPDLEIGAAYERLGQLPSKAADRARQDLAALGVAAGQALMDSRSGRWETLLMAEPMLPGSGKNNRLSWDKAGGPADHRALENAAWSAFTDYLRANQAQLRLDPSELDQTGKVTVYGDGELIYVYVPRRVGGVKVRDSYIGGTINHGNLVLTGFNRWGDVDISVRARVSVEDAMETARAHIAPRVSTESWGRPELMLIPVARGANAGDFDAGRGYGHRLAWVVRPRIEGDLGSWEALVDAHSGELVSFEDTNRYAEVKGGVYPVTNDGIVPDGVEQPGWPMPFDNVTHAGGTATTDSGGNIPGGVSGNRTSTLSGQFVRMNDNCGAISLTTTGDIDFGTSGGDDCVTPGFGGAGNTHASRTGFHELNRIVEMAQSHLPANTWLQQQLTSNMNINNTCNAFWNGVTVNFYRSGGGCFNTGEIAGVFDHEWGHGIDANDATPGIASPSGEGIADIYMAMRLDTSCIGRNFRSTVCTGFGDPCLTCTGVRDIDYLKRQSGLPHDYTWSNANCGGSVHCVGSVYAEAFWSLWKRLLTAAPYNMDNNTAHEVVNRLTFIAAGNTGTWFSGGPPNGGCSASSGYMNYLAADDDNGDLSDGTPHMGAIFTAFDDQEIACGTPTVQDSGCSGTPTVAPVVTANPLDKSVSLSWGAVAGATEYEVFRTDGVFACDFGKIKVGTTAGTTFNDSGLQNGRDYSYVVIAKGPADSCFGPASACDTVAPAAGPNLDVDVSSAALAILTGDGDEFLDNCEDGTMTFNVDNTGLGSLTNVRIVGVTATSHPATTINTSFPAAVSPSTLAQGASGVGSFSFTAGGLAANDTLTFQVDVTADEVSPIVKSANLDVTSTESDFQNFASKTFSFETDLESWSVTQGTFNRSSAIGGGDGTAWAVESSNGLHNQCDRARSPAMRLSASSTMTLWNNVDVEPFSASTWYDRANVGIIDSGGARSLVTPDGGRLYNADSNGPGNYSGCNDPEEGWAGAQATWASSSWSAGALQSGTFAGQQVQLEVIYATDPALANRGFSFDQVTVTDVDFQVADGQSDVCSAGCTIDDDCADGLFCNGTETCVAGSCQAGTPVDCDDGVSCTADSCNEATDACDNVPNDGVCDNGLFCDGAETCDPLLDCQLGTPVDCDDAVACTVDSCDEVGDTCDNAPDDPFCDDGLFCNGAETCDPILGCQPGSDPCPGGTCDEVGDVCVGCGDGTCDPGEDCVTCPADCPSFPTPGASCGNGLCEAADGEDCLTCPADCNGLQSGKPSNRFCCGNGGQNPVGCANSACVTGGFDCTEVPVGPGGNTCCGLNGCESPQEDSLTCPLDCGAPPVCGDGTCDPGESECSCSADCGLPPLFEQPGLTCTDGIDNDCDGDTDCADTDCAGDPTDCPVCSPSGGSCSQNSDCCSLKCKGNGTCK